MKGLAQHTGGDRTVQLAVLNARSVTGSQDNVDYHALSLSLSCRLQIRGSHLQGRIRAICLWAALPCDGDTEQPRATDILQGSYFRGYGAPLGVDQGPA